MLTRKSKFIKIVKGKNGKLYYYRGDGLWFGRVGEEEALKGLASGKYQPWERKVSKGWAKQQIKQRGYS